MTIAISFGARSRVILLPENPQARSSFMVADELNVRAVGRKLAIRELDQKSIEVLNDKSSARVRSEPYFGCRCERGACCDSPRSG